MLSQDKTSDRLVPNDDWRNRDYFSARAVLVSHASHVQSQRKNLIVCVGLFWRAGMSNGNQRTTNFSSSEKEFLLDLIARYPDIENRSTDKGSTQKKKRAWAELVKDFNSSGFRVVRTEASLQNLWKNMKSSAKKYDASKKRELRQTGGGSSSVGSEDPLSERVKSHSDEPGLITLHVVEDEPDGLDVTACSSTSSGTVATGRGSISIDDLKSQVLTEKLESLREERAFRKEDHTAKMMYYKQKLKAMQGDQ